MSKKLSLSPVKLRGHTLLSRALLSKLRGKLFWAILSSTALLCACSEPAPEQQLVSAVANNVILPFHQRFADSTRSLQTASSTFCADKSAAHWKNLRRQWQLAMQDWQAVQTIQFGPVMEGNQNWKIQFWPDRHNLIRKKTNALLKSDDEITVARVDKASVVIQGLSAMEFLLFDSEGGQLQHYTAADKFGISGERRCQLLLAVSSHSQNVAGDILEAWMPAGGNYLQRFSQPGIDNEEFPDSTSSIAALVDTLVASVELSKRDRLAAPLGYRGDSDQAANPRPYMAEAWRSRSSLNLLEANLRAAQQLFSGAEGSNLNDAGLNSYGIDDYLITQTEHKALAETITTLFKDVIQQIQNIDNSLFESVTDPQAAQQLASLYQQMTTLTKTLKHQLPPALGVTLGFNANDGD